MFKTSLAGAESNYSGEVITLFWITTLGSVFVGALVFGLLIYFLYKYRETTSTPRNRVTNEGKYEKIWISFAVLLVVILVVLSTPILLSIDNPNYSNAIEVDVRAHQWYWDYRFPDQNINYTSLYTNTDGSIPASSNITLKVGQWYKLNLTSTDVAHSFFSFDLGFKIDAIPGQVNIKYFKVTDPGTYIVTCAEYCGINHYQMQFKILAIA